MERLDPRFEGPFDFEDLFEHAPCGYLSADANGRITQANSTIATWMGCSAGDVVGRRFQDLLSIGGRIFYETHFAPRLRLQGFFNEVALDVAKADGGTLPVLINAVERRDAAGAVSFVHITIFDATERRRYERELLEARRSAEVASAALGSMNATLEARVAERTRERDRAWLLSQELLIVSDENGTIEAVNPVWTTLLGWKDSELLGKSFVDFSHPDDLAAALAALKGVLSAPLTTPFDHRFRHKDGSYHWFAWTAAFEAGRVYASGRDLTREREHADALRQAQKMEAVGQLTGGVAHDFNNLLTVIKSATDLMKRPDLSEERRGRYVAAISDTVDRAAKLTGQLLAFARRQALKPEVFAACDSVRGLSGMLGTLTGARIEMVTRLPEERCFVSADPSQFDTALVNMSVNARDAMGGEGRLTIHVRVVDRIPAVRMHAALAGAFVSISISDTGVGIPIHDIERIFEPFFTTKAIGQGTGLGLSQVFGFAKQSGGDVQVESDVGSGTTFTLYMPRVPEPVAAAVIAEPEPLIDGQGTCVLLVEDNQEVGAFAAQTLAELGYGTVWATSAEEALDKLTKEADRFDVVFSDVIMPGMGGIELAKFIRRDHSGLPVVLTSGYSHVLAQNGTSGFELLGKPYSIEELSRVLRKAAARRRRDRLVVLRG